MRRFVTEAMLVDLCNRYINASRLAGGLRGAVSAPAGYGVAPRSKKYVSKMKKKCYLKLKDIMLITRCCVPRTF